MRRGVIGISLLGTAIMLASGVAFTRTRTGSTEGQGEYVNLASLAPYTLQYDTGCRNWESVMVGGLQRATSMVDCLNKCSMRSGSNYANYQEDEQPGCEPKSFDGAYEGACYCFSDCEIVTNKCWDLVRTARAKATTQLTADVPAGATTVVVASQEGFNIGDKITFTGGGNTETKTVVGFASILLDSPLKYSYSAGATVTAESPSPMDTTLAPTTATSTTAAPDTTTDTA